MRIAFNASIVDPVLSGLGVYSVSLLREMAKLHDDLVVYTSCPEACRPNSWSVRRISPRVQPSRGRRGHLRRIAWIQTVLPLRLLADKASLLLSPVPEGMLVPTIPQVIVVHDLTALRFREGFPRQYHYFRYFVPAVLRRSRVIISDSESTKRDIVAFCGIECSRVYVVPCGYDRSQYRVGVDAERAKKTHRLESYLLYVGNLLPHKNLQRLLSAFALVAPKFPHQLVIAGKKDRRYPFLAAHARALGIEGRVSFLDYVPAEDLPALYAGADLFVLPSLTEGFGLPIIEAMACGTPVIASRVGSVPEVAGDAAVLVDPYDVHAMAAAMEAVLGDSGLRRVMSRSGVKQAERFDWEQTAKMVLEILREAGNR